MKGFKKKLDYELLIGRKPVQDALKDGLPIERVFIDRSIFGELEKMVRKTCKTSGIPLKVVQESELNRMTSTNHQGLLAQIAKITYHDIHDIIYQAFTSGRMPIIGILDGVTDVRNFGAIARSAEFFGVHGLLIPTSGSAAINDLAMKTSTGALTRLPIGRVRSLVNTIPVLKEAGFTIFTAEMDGKSQLRDLDWNRPIALVLGAEGSGVTREVRQQADESFVIPKLGEMESLNVSVAAGICFYECMMCKDK